MIEVGALWSVRNLHAWPQKCPYQVQDTSLISNTGKLMRLFSSDAEMVVLDVSYHVLCQRLSRNVLSRVIHGNTVVRVVNKYARH